MQNIDDKLLFSPSDLMAFMESPYASAMERLKLSDSEIQKLMDPEDPLLVYLQKKGYAHEDSFTETLIAGGHDVLELKRASRMDMAADTIKAMKAGQEVIVQGYLAHGQFAGVSDYLVKVSGKSRLGDYHYEVWDTKLSRKLKPYFAIQLCCYVEMLEIIQGVKPKYIVVVLGDNKRKYLSVDNYFAYYQSLKKAFLTFHKTLSEDLPDPADSRSFGRWSTLAKKQLEELDHLSLIANLTRLQIKNLTKAGIHTMEQLADSKLHSIPKMPSIVFEQAKLQASLQISSKGLEVPEYRVLSHEEGDVRGLAMLPPHSDKDVFFDIEGYPAEDGGLEYLWGNTYFDDAGERQFIDFWAHDAVQEKQAFIDFINWVYERWLSDPSMHVYHYANYEIAAIRKLMGRYGVCEEKVDNLLRNNVFIDLYNIVRHGLMIGEPRYSIKNVEHIYRGKRDTDVASGAESIIVYEQWRENPDGDTWQTSKVLKSIRDYNIDDCDSTQELTEWLRTEQANHDITYLLPDGEGEKEIPEEKSVITRLRDDILARADVCECEKKKKLLETLAWSLEFHRRENKPLWWRLFDRMGWSEIELYDDMDCLAGLVRTEKEAYFPPRARSAKVYEYSFDPNQPFRGQSRNFCILGEDDLKATLFEYSPDTGIISFKTSKPLPDQMDVIPDEYVRPDPIPKAIQSVIEKILESGFEPCAITDFLTRARPRINYNPEGPIVKHEGNFLDQVITASINLDNSYLCIQGPPGAGKTYTAKHIIGELLQQGKRIGISSNSHKAILNLMAGVEEYIDDNSISANLVKIGGDKNDPELISSGISYSTSAEFGSQALKQPSLCVGATAWFFSNSKFVPQEDDLDPLQPLDYLFIDEAGQVSVANLIGMSQSCRNFILMGDQMQLGQPIQGSHPGESGMSILEYLLEGHATIPDDLGIFLPKTYRMHPDVCSLISRQVYENRLKSDERANKHEVKTTGPIITQKAGICFIPVEHEGNKQASDEEVALITSLTDELLGAEFWPDEDGTQRHIGWDDMLFVAPYNYQVNKLRAVLGDQARVGSVDRFQGKEAPIVILSMCASDASESPRGIEFLFSKNRLNVAISRAQALAIVVGNPKLANTPVNNLKQMELVNFYCGILESVND